MTMFPSDAAMPLVEAVPEFLKTHGIDPVTTRLIRPGLEFQLWLDDRPKRIPIGRNTDTPAFVGELVTLDDLARRLALIGVTGWNWQARETQFIILDFDAEDHEAGYAQEVLELVVVAARRLGWVWVRHSKGGHGIHLIVELSKAMPAQTGREHQLNAKAIVARMTADAGFDFRKYLDCGGVVGFVWAPKIAENGFAVLVEPTQKAPEIDLSETMSEPIRARATVPPATLSEQHRSDIRAMQEAGFAADYYGGRLHCHSKGFEVLYKGRGRHGTYRSRSAGRNPAKANAFAFPTEDGGWTVSRFNVAPAGEFDCWYPNAQGYATARVRPPADWLVACFTSKQYRNGEEVW